MFSNNLIKTKLHFLLYVFLAAIEQNMRKVTQTAQFILNGLTVFQMDVKHVTPH